MGFLKQAIPSIGFILRFVLVSVVDKKIRVTDRIAAMIPFGL